MKVMGRGAGGGGGGVLILLIRGGRGGLFALLAKRVGAYLREGTY